MRLNTNITALSTYNSLRKNNHIQDKVMMRMASGYKINSVGDDAAGMAISNKMKIQLSGLALANKNTMDGVSLVQTADGCLTEIHNMLQRCRELAIQAATDTLEPLDRDKIQVEIDGLKEEIADSAERAEFNKIKILNGSCGHLSTCSKLAFGNVMTLTDNIRPGDYTFDIDSVGLPAILRSSDLTNGTYSRAAIDSVNAAGLSGKLTINGEHCVIEETDGGAAIFAKLSELCERVGITLEKDASWGDGTTGGELTLTTKQAGSNQHIDISGPLDLLYGIGLGFTVGGDYTADPSTPPDDLPLTNVHGKDASISNLEFLPAGGTVSTPLSATSTVIIQGNRIKITDLNDRELVIDLNVKRDGADYYIGHNHPNMGADIGIMINEATGVPASAVDLGFHIREGGLKIQAGANKGLEINVLIQDFSCYGLEVDHSSVRSLELAQNAITEFDEAVAKVSVIRAKLGAYANRFEFTSKSLDAAYENTAQSLSRIVDTDMAYESSEYAKYSVMVQAGLSVMGQANMRPQQLLSLLK